MLKSTRLLSLLGFLFLNLSSYAQNAPVVVQAESGAVREVTNPAAIVTATEDGTSFVRVVGNFITLGGVTQSPNAENRVLSYTVTFPAAGAYDLYARVRIGPEGANDDSFYYGNSFGTRSALEPSRWVMINNIWNVGYTTVSDVVAGTGSASQSNVWKWIRLSALANGTFTVPTGGLTQTFEIGSRENGLDIDKFVFGASGVFFTVGNLDNGQQGSTTPPPAPFVSPGPPIATGKPKFLGGVFSNSQKPSFNKYWNQVVSENDGKWGSVEGTRNVMNWVGLDSAYQQAQRQNIPFRMHVLVWGNQQPTWMENLTPAEQLAEIKEWYAAVAQRYPNIAFLEVVNEPTNDPPRKRNATDQGSGNYIEALGGDGATGWDWVINSFKLAREYFPNTKLMLNDYSVENTAGNAQRYLNIINLLKQQNLIDVIGIQGHAFSTRPTPAATLTSNLDLLATSGLPLYITELDIDGLLDDVQLAEYQRIFPLFWEHPAVQGVTLWGYRPGHWRTAQGAYLAYENGAERPALKWLREYVKNTELSTINTNTPLAASAFCPGSSVSVPFTVAGTVAPGRTFTAQLSDASGSFATPTAIGTTTASTAGTYAIAATIPATAAVGSLYRIRVASSGPSVLGNANNTNLTVNSLPTPDDIVVTPSSNVYTGGVATTLYLGYGSQSATLTASGGASYQWSPATGLSDASVANPVFTATEAGEYTFTVTVTNAQGCSATKQVTLTVLDVRCSNNINSGKVLVCRNGQVLCISENAVPTHLTNTQIKSVLGACSQAAVASSTASSAAATTSDEGRLNEKTLGRSFQAYPNPFTERAMLRFHALQSATAQVQVYNQLGQLVNTLFNAVTEEGKTYELTLDGKSLPAGIYTCRLLTNGHTETTRLVLVK